jgi:hypothetical protein
MKIPIKETIKLIPEIKEDYLTEPLLEGEKPFSSFKFQTEVSQEDIQMVRNWKNELVKLRDKYKGTDKYVTFELELKHTVEFLNKFSE